MALIKRQKKVHTTAQVVAALIGKPVRTCRSMHECSLCDRSIKLGEEYRDGGLDRRAHVECFEDALTETRLACARAK